VVDIGCGRGEWLEVLHDHHLAARGVDTNRVMVATCRELELDVTEEDGIEYLRAQAPGSLGAVTAIHVIEHLPFAQLIALFDAALRALQPGGMIAFETPNPENLLVGASTFYLDPTHQRPLAPELMRFIAQSRGFTDVQILRLHPYPVENRVQDGEGELHERFNALLYGPQDYAIVAVKG
jgi:O-antigen chain-terminating methyltransferase